MDNDFFLNSVIQPHPHFELSSSSFYNPTLEQHSMDQYSQFESALSSMVSSPVSTNTSCYNTPKNSPPNHFVNDKLPIVGNSINNYPPIAADPGFAERAAKFSCFGSRSFNGRTTNNGNEVGYRSSPLMVSSMKLTRVLSSPPLNQLGIQENKNLGNSQVENMGSSQVPESGSKKRKAVSRARSKEAKAVEENGNLKTKRLKDNDLNESGSGKNDEKHGNGDENEEEKANTKAPEPFKDYIHVRARRGQATDSHSLAERVRREKIGERMKLLQDLVPGCNKVTGKALMLDEIINYVQSLQRQVEFLSMKLATVNPMLDFNMESLLSKDIIQPNGSVGNQIDSSASALFGHHAQKVSQVHRNNIFNEATMDPLHTIFRNNIGLQSNQPHDFSHGLTQFQTLCEDDLQSIVQMGLSREAGFNSQDFSGLNQASNMKLEL